MIAYLSPVSVTTAMEKLGGDNGSICSLGEHLVQAPRESSDDKNSDNDDKHNVEAHEAAEPEGVSFNVGSEIGVEVKEEEEEAAHPSLEEEEEKVKQTAPRVCRPYTLRAVEGLFALLVDLLNPEQHQEPVIKVALTLLTVAMETGADFLHACPEILSIISMDMTKYLVMLLYRDRISLFASTLRVCFLLFESLRAHLKLQIEVGSSGGCNCFY